VSLKGAFSLAGGKGKKEKGLKKVPLNVRRVPRKGEEKGRKKKRKTDKRKDSPRLDRPPKPEKNLRRKGGGKKRDPIVDLKKQTLPPEKKILCLVREERKRGEPRRPSC